MLKLGLAGSGRASPRRLVTSDEIDARLGLQAGTLETATGVTSRGVVADESQVDLAVAAARAALDEAGVAADELGLCLFAAAVPYQPIPSTAPLILRELGVPDGQAMGFDVNATCLGFLTALDMAARMQVGRDRPALVVSAEIASRALPWQDDPETAALFGDGAAAVVLHPDAPGALKAARMETYPSAFEACQIGAGGTRFDFHAAPEDFARHALFRMDGKELFRVTTRHFRAFVERLLDEAGWAPDDVDLVVPHQASPFALAHLARQTGFAGDRLVDISRRCGNQIAASIPFAFDVARKDGRAGAGKRVLLLGTSAGVSFGGLALEL